MAKYDTVIKKFGEQGEKSSWHYIEVPAAIADEIKKGYKKSFRVKGSLDNYKIERTSLLPMGGGNFIIPLKADVRKFLGKRKGAIVLVKIEEDKRPVEISSDFMQCLRDEPKALEHFNSLPGSHRNYFSKWIDSAKTEETKTSRIARAVNGLALQLGYPEMMRTGRNEKFI
ncbi:MAG: YdeI/OmpD-associated family protein [Ginsengibacter sp.]